MALGNVHLTPQLVRAVRDAADILAVASDHTRLRKGGRNYQGLCPLHKEKTPSFSVDPTKGVFYCFGCGQGGDAIKLHMLATGDDFPAAIEALAIRYGIPLPRHTERRSGAPERDLEGALGEAAQFFVAALANSPPAQRYLSNRRVAPELITRFGLGYAPDDWHAIERALAPRIPLADLEAAGLVGRSERRGGEPFSRFRNRLMFPIHNAAGRLVGFGGRTLGDDPAKYVNTAETDRFHKGTLLYGLHQAKKDIREGGRAILVEGYFDVLAVFASGREAAVGGMGTALTPEQAKLLSRYTEEVVVAYDGDSAGEGAFRRALPLLLAEGLGVRRALFPAGDDPDSLRVEKGESEVARVIDQAPDAVSFEIERMSAPDVLAEPRTQAKAAGAIAELLRPIPDAILRRTYAQVAAQRLHLPADLLARRAAGERQRSAAPAARPAPPPKVAPPRREVRSLEEAALATLLRGEEPVPPLADMPPAAAFLNPVFRNIYQAFYALYSEEGTPPEGRALLSGFGPHDPVVDRMAEILVEEPVGQRKVGLLESLDNLMRRFREQRLRELVGEIVEAQRTGDVARVERLNEERTALSRSLHGRPQLPAGGSN
jgi:DNA primase